MKKHLHGKRHIMARMKQQRRLDKIKVNNLIMSLPEFKKALSFAVGKIQKLIVAAIDLERIRLGR